MNILFEFIWPITQSVIIHAFNKKRIREAKKKKKKRKKKKKKEKEANDVIYQRTDWTFLCKNE